MEDGIADTLDAMFAAAAPDRPVTGIDYEFTTAYTHDYVMGCRLHQDGDADTELTTELHLSSDLSEDAISSSPPPEAGRRATPGATTRRTR